MVGKPFCAVLLVGCLALMWSTWVHGPRILLPVQAVVAALQVFLLTR